jgi:hypothetical protein
MTLEVKVDSLRGGICTEEDTETGSQLSIFSGRVVEQLGNSDPILNVSVSIDLGYPGWRDSGSH